MQERKLNMFAKQEEYMALRQYIKLVSDASGGAAGALRRAINSELTKRQKQLIGMYYIEQMPKQAIAAGIFSRRWKNVKLTRVESLPPVSLNFTH